MNYNINMAYSIYKVWKLCHSHVAFKGKSLAIINGTPCLEEWLYGRRKLLYIMKWLHTYMVLIKKKKINPF